MWAQIIILISSHAVKVLLNILFALFVASFRSGRELKLSAVKWVSAGIILFIKIVHTISGFLTI